MSRVLSRGLIAPMLVFPHPAFAHEGQPIAPHDLWSAWSFEPVVLALLVASGAMFTFGAAKLRAKVGRWPTGFSLSATAFFAGWLVLAISLLSPLHALGSALFSAHMAQHELLMVVAAPLLVAGRPIIPAIWSFSESERRGFRTVVRAPAVSIVSGALTRPVVAFFLHAAAIWLWHLPSLYQATVSSELVHTAQHASFLITALLFWWTVLGPRSRRRSGVALLSLFVTALHTGLLGALLTFSTMAWYPVYFASTGPWGLSPIEDQQLGGLIMWIPGGLAYLIVALVIGARLLRDSAEETRVTAGSPMGPFHGHRPLIS